MMTEAEVEKLEELYQHWVDTISTILMDTQGEKVFIAAQAIVNELLCQGIELVQRTVGESK